MPQPKIGIVIASSFLAIALAGCQSGRFNSQPASAPAPLTPAPSGTVTGNQLPPPAMPNGQGQFPDAPQQPGDDQMAALDPSLGTGTGADAVELSQNSLLGSWTVDSGGSSCQMFLTLTKYGDASRGGTRGCSNELANMRSWELAGRQVVIHDETGNTIARLYSSGGERLDGQTTNGTPVTVSR